MGEALASETNVTISGLWPVYEQLKLNLNKTENVIHNSIQSSNLETDSVQLFDNTEDIHFDKNILQEESSNFFSQINYNTEEDGDTDETLNIELSQPHNHVELLIKDAIFEKLSKRYFENFKTKQLIQLASFLDPRYKAYCLNDCDSSIIKQLLIEELKNSGDQSGEINKNKSLSSKKKTLFW